MSAFRLIREKQRVGPEVHLTVTEKTPSRSLRWSQLSTFTGGWPLKSCLWVHQRIVHYTEKICIRCFNKWQFFMYMHSEDMFYRCIQIRLGSVDIKKFFIDLFLPSYCKIRNLRWVQTYISGQAFQVGILLRNKDIF